jgi:hypothetical protein
MSRSACVILAKAVVNLASRPRIRKRNEVIRSPRIREAASHEDTFAGDQDLLRLVALVVDVQVMSSDR